MSLVKKPEPKHWIAGAVKHPGRETAKAEQNGVSLGEQLKKDSHSSDPSVRGAGLLGLRFRKGIGR
jgi:hypothetical protein